MAYAENAARTIVPQYKTAAELFYRFTYWKTDVANAPVTAFPKEAGTACDYETLTSATFTLLAGDYTFVLTAYADESATTEMLTAQKTISLTEDTAELSFALQTPESNGTTQATGSVSVSFAFPQLADLQTVTAKLLLVSDLTTTADEKALTPSVLADGTQSVTYAASGIPMGTYLLFLTVTDGAGRKTVIPDMVIVAANAESKTDKTTDENGALVISDVQANVRYELYVSETGDDETGTGKIAAPFKTLAKAVKALNGYALPEKDWTVLVSGTVRGTTSISTINAASLAIIGKTGLDASGNPQDILDAQETAGTEATDRVLNLTNTVPVTLSKLTITNGVTTGNGGGIAKAGTGTLTISDCTISGNTAKSGTGGGGGVFITSSGTVMMTSGTINRNNASYYGGGVYVYSGTFETSGTAVISGNTANTSGGGVYVRSSAIFTMTDGTISNNTADHAGGVSSNGTFTMSGGIIKGNTANLNGGGVYNTKTFTMTGGTISRNTANSGGGGVCNAQSGTFTISGTAVIGGDREADGNKSLGSSYGGGGIYDAGGTTIIEGGTIGGNTAASVGGGISTLNTAKLTVTDGIIKGNTAGTSGGGVYVNSSATFTMSGGQISGNKAQGTESENGGGGVYNAGTMFMHGESIIGSDSFIRAASDGSFSNRVIGNKFGGGIYNKGSLYLGYSAYTSETENTPATLNGGVYFNYAPSGGGIYVTNSSKTFIASGNIALNGASGYGGGIYTFGSAQVTMTGGTFSKNHAGTNGGGIYKSGPVSGNLFKLTGGLVSENTSGGKGSGIDLYNGDFYIGGTAQVAQDNVLFIDFGTTSPKLSVISTLTESAVATIALSDSKYVVGTQVLNGTADLLASEHGKFTMADDTNGGKWRVDENGKLAECPTFHVSASGDDSTGNGTSVSPFATIARAVTAINDNADATEDYTISVSGTVTGTTAISTLTAASLTIRGVTGSDTDILDGNSAGTVLKIGANVAADITLKNLTIQNGRATEGGGINKAGTGSLTITACTITGCNASNNGGGLYVSGAGEVTLNGGSLITNCKQTGGGGGIGGGAICINAASATSATVTLDDASLTNCSTAVSGGGVYMKTGSLTLKNGSISGNTASGNSMSSGGNDGGGVYVNIGTFTMMGGEISGNSAVNGGGVGVASTFTMSGGTISGNTATESGGGVYVSGTFTMSDGTISGNTDANGGAGVYKNSGRATKTGGIISDACYPANLF